MNVRCVTGGCANQGIVRTVPDRPVARGVVARPPLFCAACGAALENVRSDHHDREEAVHHPPETR